ncbi:MAG: DUF6427 family protein [Bacteroidota bacterium]
MILRLFLGNQLAVLFLIPLVVFGYLFCNHSIGYFEYTSSLDLGLWGLVKVKEIANYLPWLSGILVCLNAYLLNFFFNRNGFHEKNSYVVSLLYVILMSYYRSFYYADGLLLAHTFILIAFMLIFQLEYNQEGRKLSFNFGFFFGVAITFHPALIFILPFVWLMMTRIRPFVFREAILVCFGMAVPILYSLILAFYVNKEINFNFIESTKRYTQKELIFLVSLVLFALLLITSWVGIRNKTLKSSIRFRKNTQVLYLFLWFSIGLGTVDWIFYQQYEWFCYSTLPIALFLPFSYLNVKYTFISDILFYTVFGFSVIKFFI